MNVWSSSFDASATDARSESWSFGPSDISNSGNRTNQAAGAFFNTQNHTSLDLNVPDGCLTQTDDQSGPGISHSQTLQKSSQSHLGELLSYTCPNYLVTSGDSGTPMDIDEAFGTYSSGTSGNSSTLMGIDEPSCTSLFSSGSSYRRKSPEGTSGQFHHGESSNTNSSAMKSPIPLPISPSNALNGPHMLHVSDARSVHPFPSNGCLSSQFAGPSSSYPASQERGRTNHEQVNCRSSLRSNDDYPVPETSNVIQDQIDRSFGCTTTAAPRDRSSGSRTGPTSGLHNAPPVWMPHHIFRTQNQQISENSPWNPLQRVESNSENQISHFSFLPSASSPPREAASSVLAHNQSDQRSVLSVEVTRNVNGWGALTEGRHVMDHRLFDPFIDEFAGFHDWHRDMRLDVDSMSYEELLALEEIIGNVSMGLSEEKVMGSMKQRKYKSTGLENLEPCCICQEDYAGGDDIGILNCEHEFHTNCIKQWLVLKNLCPICKATAFEA